MVLILLPEEHIHPELSGRVLHSSPSRHGSISHHHLPMTMDAGEGEHRQGNGDGFSLHTQQGQTQTIKIVPANITVNWHN